MSQPKLLDRVRHAIRVRHYSPKTEQAYVHWIKRFILFHHKRHPAEMGNEEVSDFLSHLATHKRVSASTQNQALNAILFLYRVVLDQQLDWLKDVVRAKRPRRIPVVLSRGEIKSVFDYLSGESWLMASLMYGAGLRLMECLRLRVKDIDFSYKQITVRDGKGQKDRVTLLPESVIAPMQRHLMSVKALHDTDRQEGFGEVYLPYALERKYPSAGKQWGWQYIFPASKRSVDPRSNIVRRHHCDESVPQKAVKNALRAARIFKPASCHTLRHSFATHLLEDGYDIRTIAAPAHPCARGIRTSMCSTRLLGHSDVSTTMIYTHVIKKGGKGARSPLDRMTGPAG
jgi:integron integrase